MGILRSLPLLGLFRCFSVCFSVLHFSSVLLRFRVGAIVGLSLLSFGSYHVYLASRNR